MVRVKCAAVISISDYIVDCRWLETVLAKRAVSPEECDQHLTTCTICRTRLDLMGDNAAWA
jgi:hypothetical protein